jgi:hypothetical protein
LLISVSTPTLPLKLVVLAFYILLFFYSLVTATVRVIRLPMSWLSLTIGLVCQLISVWIEHPLDFVSDLVANDIDAFIS